MPPEQTLHVREMHVRAEPQAGGAREFTGIAVPWNDPVTIRDWFGEYTEEFERGSVQDSERALAYWRHSEPIGRITSARDTDAGWEITGVISETPRGDEAYTLLKDGVIDRMSIGFDFGEYREEHNAETGEMHLVHTKVKVREVSLVPFPAYDAAQVAAVRHQSTPSKEKPMPPEADTITRADIAEVTKGLDELTRSVDLMKINGLPTAPQAGPQFRSFGEYVKAVASGDEAALRAYAGAVSGDGILKDAWIGDLVRIMGEKQRVLSAFTKGALPPEGLGVEYAVLKSDTTQVGKQTAEGEDLLFGKVSIDIDRADVETYGGWTSLSRQAIERTSNVDLLTTTFTALAIKYARAIELLTRATVLEGVTAAEGIEANLTTQDGILAALVDTAEYFDDHDRTLHGLFVAKDVFLDLLAVPATDRVLQVSQEPTDKLGTVTVSSIEANLAGIKVQLFPNAPAGTSFAYDSMAVKTLESPGAPLRLQDENIVNLTKDFSVYGYASSFVQVPDGLVRLEDTTP